MRPWLSLFLAAALVPATALAQRTTNTAAAEALYNEGRKLLDQKRFAEACAKLEESQRLDPGMGTQFFLADCYEQLGKVTTAWQLFRDVEAAARSAGRADRLEVAKKRADALEKKVARLLIEVPWGDKTPGAEVHRVDGKDDVLVGHAQWGMAVPVDPGKYTLKAIAPGKKPLETGVEVTLGQTTTVTLPALADLPAEAPPPPPTTPQLIDRGATIRSAGWVTSAVGLTTLSAGVIIGIIGKVRYDDSNAECIRLDGPDMCTQKGIDARVDGQSFGNVGTALFFVGAGAMLGGLAMVFLAPKPTIARLVPTLGPRSAGLFLEGSF